MATGKRSPARTPQQKPVSNHQREEILSANWSGPLPPPGALQQFDGIIENGAERIMSMVEQEQAHRMGLEKQAMLAEIWDSIGGKTAGFLMTMAAIAGAIYTSMHGAPWQVSVAIVGVPIMALIGKFVSKK